MNIVLGILQGLLAVSCISGGAYQIFQFDQLQQGVAAMRELPRGLWAFLGAFGCLTGLALVLPGVLHMLPRLTPFAALAVAAQSLLISAFYLRFGDSAPLPYSIAMAFMAAFIAYGRFVLVPL